MSTYDRRGQFREQPMPANSAESVDVFPLLIADIEARNAKGWETYGQSLHTFDGRDALWDAYEEALDLAVYLRKAIAERDALREGRG